MTVVTTPVDCAVAAGMSGMNGGLSGGTGGGVMGVDGPSGMAGTGAGGTTHALLHVIWPVASQFWPANILPWWSLAAASS